MTGQTANINIIDIVITIIDLIIEPMAVFHRALGGH